jgi:hypothetical protein
MSIVSILVLVLCAEQYLQERGQRCQEEGSMVRMMCHGHGQVSGVV